MSLFVSVFCNERECGACDRPDCEHYCHDGDPSRVTPLSRTRDVCPYCGHRYPRGREAAGPEIDAHLSACPGPCGCAVCACVRAGRPGDNGEPGPCDQCRAGVHAEVPR